MSDEQTIGAIKKRNEEFANCEDPSHRAPDGTITHRPGKADIDTLLSEIEARDAEIERLRRENIDMRAELAEWEAMAE